MAAGIQLGWPFHWRRRARQAAQRERPPFPGEGKRHLGLVPPLHRSGGSGDLRGGGWLRSNWRGRRHRRDLARPGSEPRPVNRADALLPTGAGPWISHLPQSQVVHVRNGDVADYERVLRLIWRSSRFRPPDLSRRARALAHIGAVQALEETDVPTDAVAGAGMGALIGALVVKNVKAMDIRERMRRYLIEGNPIRNMPTSFPRSKSACHPTYRDRRRQSSVTGGNLLEGMALPPRQESERTSHGP